VAKYLTDEGFSTCIVVFDAAKEVPEYLCRESETLIVGLVRDADQIEFVRRQMRDLSKPVPARYLDINAITEDLKVFRRRCDEHKWPIVDAQGRNARETAEAVIKLYEDYSRARGGSKRSGTLVEQS
jgi:regulator of PEP synthase PpsR (kinase-PPPase family)